MNTIDFILAANQLTDNVHHNIVVNESNMNVLFSCLIHCSLTSLPKKQQHQMSIIKTEALLYLTR